MIFISADAMSFIVPLGSICVLGIIFYSHAGFSFHKQVLQKSLHWAITYKFDPFFSSEGG